MIKGIYKESVELTFVYQVEGCEKTQAKINDTIPHTRIDMGVRVRRTRPATGIYTKVSVVPYRPLALKTSPFSTWDSRKTLSQICNVRRQKPRDLTNVRKSFYKRTTLTGVLHRRIRKRCELFHLMRLPKQLDQIFQLANEFDDDESDPASMTVDECWIESRYDLFQFF
jgi:hypothetical protein